MDKNNELLPCPFCGTQPKEQASLGVWCDHDDCAIMGQVFSGGASHWNRRAASPADQVLIAARELINQIEKAAPVDDHGHRLCMNAAFIKLKELL